MGVKIQSEVVVLKEPTHPSLLSIPAPSSSHGLPAVEEIPRMFFSQELLVWRICRVQAGPGELPWPKASSEAQGQLRGRESWRI